MRTSVFFIILITFSTLSCKKKREQIIPNVSFNYYLYLSDPQFVNINAVGGWVYITGGSRGIIVYRKSQDEFVALDRHCTYEPEKTCGIVQVDSSNILLVDSCCSSKFLITDGSVNKGPATVPLREYLTEYDGNKLRVYN